MHLLELVFASAGLLLRSPPAHRLADRLRPRTPWPHPSCRPYLGDSFRNIASHCRTPPWSGNVRPGRRKSCRDLPVAGTDIRRKCPPDDTRHNAGSSLGICRAVCMEGKPSRHPSDMVAGCGSGSRNRHAEQIYDGALLRHTRNTVAAEPRQTGAAFSRHHGGIDCLLSIFPPGLLVEQPAPLVFVFQTTQSRIPE